VPGAASGTRTRERDFMIIFDSDAFPAEDRADALAATICDMETPQRVTFNADAPVRHRMEVFGLGTGVHLLRNTGSPIHVVRDDRHVRLGSREEIAVYIQGRGTTLVTAGGGASELTAGQLGGVDVTRPYAAHQSGDCENTVLLIEYARLDLPVDLIRTAVPRMRSSPLHALVREHLLHLAVDLPTDAAAMAGRATAELIAALLASVGGGPGARDAVDATGPACIAAWIDEHLGEAELTVERIAVVHGMSTRSLAALWQRVHGVTPGAWITRRRLERARRLNDGAHLDLRFRAEYGSGQGPLRSRPASTESGGGDADPGQ
jgi:AraC family transcriptional activator of tynA and feaB